MAAPPPIYVGGRGEPALRRAARFGDFWLPMWLTPERVADRSAQMAEFAAELGRPTPRTALLILCRIDDDRAAGRAAAEAHIRGQYQMELEAVERWTLLDSIDGAVERPAGSTVELGVVGRGIAADTRQPTPLHPVRAASPRSAQRLKPLHRGRITGPDVR